MINPAPYNAEAPPEALAGEITPTRLHYVRSNFALPDHDGTLEVGGAVDNPTTLTLDELRAMPRFERAVTLECAGNGASTRDRYRSGNPRAATQSPPHAGPAPSSPTCWSRRTPQATASTSGSRAPTTARTK